MAIIFCVLNKVFQMLLNGMTLMNFRPFDLLVNRRIFDANKPIGPIVEGISGK